MPMIKHMIYCKNILKTIKIKINDWDILVKYGIYAHKAYASSSKALRPMDPLL